ncbi:hypothetical protein ABDK09_14800 [Vibrio sp. CDRSL-10 TSBA]
MTKASVINDFPWDNKSYKYVDLPSLCGQQISSFPYVLRLLLENTVRNHSGDERFCTD